MQDLLRRAPWWIPVLLALPVAWFVGAGQGVMARESFDLVGHLWTTWNATLGDPTRSEMIAWPRGVDLMPILGGWADVLLGSLLVPWVGLARAHNLVVVTYLFVAGAGGWALARVLGVGPVVAPVCGLLLQLDGFVLTSVRGGRTEQVGLGFVALALAGAIHTWRNPGWKAVVGTGLAGAAVVYVSWELPIVLVAGLLVLTPFLVWEGRSRAALRRWIGALAVAVALAGPWATLFYIRAAAVRELDEGAGMIDFVLPATIGLARWFIGDYLSRPAPILMLTLLLVPWVAPRADRRLWLGIAATLVGSLALALGPAPGLWQPGDLRPWGIPWGPYRLFQDLPFLGWFHTPDRFVVAWSLAVPVAVGLGLHRLAHGGRIARVAAVPLAALALAAAAWPVLQNDLWPDARYVLPGGEAMARIRDLPGDGALLDLPPQANRLRVMTLMAFQVTHGRPIPYHAALPHLQVQTLDDIVEGDEFLWWLRRTLEEGPKDPPTLESLLDLRRKGIRFIVLHQPYLPHAWDARRLVRVMRPVLGPPLLEEDGLWYCWELPEG